jgi:DNA-damage-inducible protein J
MCAQSNTIKVGQLSLIQKIMPTINIRTDAKLKKAATKILEGMGLDMSSAVKLFLSQVVITKKIPFQIRTVNGFTIEEEEEMIKEMKETEKLIKEGKVKLYDSAKELHDDILRGL